MTLSLFFFIFHELGACVQPVDHAYRNDSSVAYKCPLYGSSKTLFWTRRVWTHKTPVLLFFFSPPGRVRS